MCNAIPTSLSSTFAMSGYNILTKFRSLNDEVIPPILLFVNILDQHHIPILHSHATCNLESRNNSQKSSKFFIYDVLLYVHIALVPILVTSVIVLYCT